jgi:hypothetical protein
MTNRLMHPRYLALVSVRVLLAPPAWAGITPTPFRTGLVGITPLGGRR